MFKYSILFVLAFSLINSSFSVRDKDKFDFTATTLNGREVKSSDFENKIVVINIWAT